MELTGTDELVWDSSLPTRQVSADQPFGFDLDCAAARMKVLPADDRFDELPMEHSRALLHKEVSAAGGRHTHTLDCLG